MAQSKGSSVAWALVLIFGSLFISIFLGLTIYGFNLATNTIGQDVEVGQVNLQNITNQTLGRINTAFVTNADSIGILMLLGMCFMMILNGYFFGKDNPKLFLVVDIFLLALFFIPSIYVSQAYSTFINSSTVFQNTFITIIPKVSKFMLNLPVIVGAVGIITMIVSYAGISRGTAELTGDDVNVMGY